MNNNIWKIKKEFASFLDKRSGRSAAIGDACQSKKAERHLDESSRISERLGQPSRAAYRRDNIKLRNRRYNKAVGARPTALIRILIQ